MDTIELWSGTTKALIDPIGAWLTNLSDDRGALLYPKRTLTDADGVKKQRGGCHVCLPNFGPGGESDQPQHGFGREVIWAVEEVNLSQVVLKLAHGSGDYESLAAKLIYALSERRIEVSLELSNNGSTSLRVAPGFHPYFVLDREEQQVVLNGQTYDTAELEQTDFFADQTEMKLSLQRHDITVSSSGLSVWALWADRLAEYVCVEPTFGGNTFLEPVREDERLMPGATCTYTMAISW